MTNTTSSTGAYEALRACARRRIEEEWVLTGREMRLLRIIELLSFGQGQMFACVPCQGTLGIAAGLHKSDTSRILKRLIQRGALSKRQHRDETLYRLELHDDTMPRRPRTVEAATALQELVDIQKRRHNGQADANGQIRLPGVLGPTNEDTGLEVEALRALAEEDGDPPPTASPPLSRVHSHGPVAPEQHPIAPKQGDDAVMQNNLHKTHIVPEALLPGTDPADLEARSQRLMLELEARQESVESWLDRDLRESPEEVPAMAGQYSGALKQHQATRPGSKVDLESFKRNLSPDLAQEWDRLVREFSRTPGAISNLKRFAGLWRNRLKAHPNELREAISDHQLRKDGPADAPGAYIYRRLQRHLLGQEAG